MAPRRPERNPQINPADMNREVTGPTSALTSFLREQGITGGDNRMNRRPAPNPTLDIPSQGQINNLNNPTSQGASNGTIAEEEDEEEQDELAGENNNENAVASGSGLKRSPSTNTSNTLKTTIPNKKKKLDDLKGGREAFQIPQGHNIGRPIVPGSFATCSECGKKFTVSKYTIRNPRGPGVLCTPCSTDSIEDLASNGLKLKGPVVKVAPPKKRGTKAIDERELKPVKTLQSSCISVIGKNINNLEGLGDLGPKNLKRISQIVSKHRALNPDNLGLFLDVGHKELTLFDCALLQSKDFSSIAQFCPHLERLSLKMCGRLDGDVLEVWGKRLMELKYLSLYAPYLVTFQQWISYLSTFSSESSHQLEGFGLMQSARFNDDCIKILVANNPNLYNLQLSELGKLNDDSLKFLYPLRNLTSLDISRAGLNQGRVLTDDGVNELLKEIGSGLVELVLDQNYLLTDSVLLDGILPHCTSLSSLSLSSLNLLTSAAVAGFFLSFHTNPGLTHLNLHRCILLENESVDAIITHSGKSLIELDLHSIDELDEDGCKRLAGGMKQLRKLDISFVRAVDDFVLKGLLDGLKELKTIFIHGCNRVTAKCPQKRGVSIRGQENCLLVEL